MQQVQTREDRLRLFSNGQRQPGPSEIEEPSANPGLWEKCPAAIDNFPANGDPASIKNELFGGMKPLREQIAEAGTVQKPGMSERERRLMLRDLERKKRQAGLGTGDGGYGRIVSATSEPEKENLSANHVSSPAQEMTKPRMEDEHNVQAMKGMMPLTMEKISGAMQVKSPPKQISQLPVSDQMLDGAYERERQRKETELQVMRAECMKAQERREPQSRQRQNADDSMGTGLAMGNSRVDEADQRRAKQLKYREQLEEQLKHKRRSQMADEVFREVAASVSARNETAPVPQEQRPMSQEAPAQAEFMDERQIARMKAEKYALELQAQIALKHGRTAAAVPTQSNVAATVLTVQSPAMPAAEEDPRRKQMEEYSAYLQQQMLEHQEAKRHQQPPVDANIIAPVSVPVAEPQIPQGPTVAQASAAGYARFKKQGITEGEERKRQQFQADLKRQIEDRERQRAAEKQRMRDEADKEELRIQREKDSLIAKQNAEIAHERSEKSSRRKAPEQARRTFEPSADNSLVPATMATPRPQPPAECAKTAIKEVPALPAMMATMPTIRPAEPVPAFAIQTAAADMAPTTYQAANPGYFMQSPMMEPVPEPHMLGEYQRQIEALRAEKQLAREEALIYKEQLLRERENQMQDLMRRMQTNPPQEVQQMSAKVPMPNARDVFEQSLASDSKLVQAVDPSMLAKAEEELYRTWNPEKLMGVANRLNGGVKMEAVMTQPREIRGIEIAMQTELSPAPPSTERTRKEERAVLVPMPVSKTETKPEKKRPAVAEAILKMEVAKRTPPKDRPLAVVPKLVSPLKKETSPETAKKIVPAEKAKIKTEGPDQAEEEEYSNASFESDKEEKDSEMPMTEPKFGENEATAALQRRSSSSVQSDSPTPKATGTLLPAVPAEEVSVIVHKGEDESICSVNSRNMNAVPLTESNVSQIPVNVQLGPNPGPTSACKQSCVPAENPRPYTATSAMAGTKENAMAQNLPGAILGYERRKKMTHIKITDLREARMNRGKESYILVLCCIANCEVE